MRSYSRNSRETGSWLGLAAAASLLLGSAAQAGEHDFVLTAYTNGRGGQALLTGDYESAGKALSYKPTLSTFDTSTNSNNRCVTLTVTKQWNAAKAACDKAVRDAVRDKTMLPSFEAWARNAQDNYIAVALSNRAVMHWMADENAAAAADLERAEQLAPKSDFIQRNKLAFEYSRHESTRVDVASK
jgi:hypothetical protein